MQVVRRGLAVAAVAALIAGCGAQAAPATGALPLMSGARVIAAAPGGSDVDNAYDRKQYRYMAVGGPAGVSAHRFLAAQIALMLRQGWTAASGLPSVKKNSASFLSAWYGTVGIEFNSPSHGVYASLLVVRDADAAAEDESGSPIGGNTTAAGGNAAIVRALAHHEPVLWVVLGNGTAR